MSKQDFIDAAHQWAHQFDNIDGKRQKMTTQKKIKVKISGKEYDTVMVDGVQRFPQNKIIRDLLDHATEYGKFGMNEIARDTHLKKYSPAERRELYRLVGYSVCGYAEIFEHDKIENPLWKK